jgi:hypothetical protein
LQNAQQEVAVTPKVHDYCASGNEIFAFIKLPQLGFELDTTQMKVTSIIG